MFQFPRKVFIIVIEKIFVRNFLMTYKNYLHEEQITIILNMAGQDFTNNVIEITIQLPKVNQFPSSYTVV